MIEFEDAGFSYGGGQILADISLRLAPGSFHFLTGPSGSGKTTFLKLCYLALRPTAGRMRFLGTAAESANRDAVADFRRRIGVVHQDCKFLDHLSVTENITLPLHVAGRDPARHSNDLAELLDWVGLSARANAMPPELSGGERQRAALARAVILSPEMVIADEPTGNVDREMGARLMALLVELNRMGRTILVATHDLDLIRQVKADAAIRVLRLQQGQVQTAGADL